MKVYHGTTRSKGELILRDRKLKSNGIERHFDSMFPTTDGYVYLGTLDKALYYGNVKAVQTREDYLYIFEFDIPEELLLVDIDEIEYTIKPWPNLYKEVFKNIENPTFRECWENCKTARVKGDISLDKYKTRRVELKSTANRNENAEELFRITRLCNEPYTASCEKVNNYCNSLKWEFIKR